MGFGKRVKKEDKDEIKHNESNKKSTNKTDSFNCNSNSVDSSYNTSDISIKQKRATSFIKKLGKNKKANVLLFGQTKEQKLEQFVENIKTVYPNMPDFWQQKEIDKFKKKFMI